MVGRQTAQACPTLCSLVFEGRWGPLSRLGQDLRLEEAVYQDPADNIARGKDVFAKRRMEPLVGGHSQRGQRGVAIRFVRVWTMGYDSIVGYTQRLAKKKYSLPKFYPFNHAFSQWSLCSVELSSTRLHQERSGIPEDGVIDIGVFTTERIS